jgi:peptide/nickel transport system substrate-binding protein
MRMRTKRLNGLVALGVASVLVLGACATNSGSGGEKTGSSTGFAECESKPNTCNSGTTKKGGTIVVAIEKTISNWLLWDEEGNTYETGEIINGIAPSAFTTLPDGEVQWNQDLFASEPKLTSENPETVEYKISPNATWSDGTTIDAKDFIYNYKSNNGKDCPDCTVAGTTGYDQIASVTGSADGKTVTVVYKTPFPDWKSLFSGTAPLYPAHIAEKSGDINTAAGLAKAFTAFKTAVPDWTAGPYKFGDYQKDVSVTLVPNDKWYGKTKPALDKVIFKIIEDQAQQIPAMQNKEIQAMISQPNLDMVTKIKGMQGVEYNLSRGPTWEHIDLNLKNKYLADKALRQAIFTAIDRQAIIDKTVGPFFDGAKPLNNHNIIGDNQAGFKDVITPTGQGKGDVEAAKKILTDAGYKIEGNALKTKDGAAVPPIRFGFTNGNVLRQATGEVVQQELAQIGVKVQLDPFKSLGEALGTGNFDIIIFAWVGSPFLAGNKDLWSTNAGSNYGKYSNPDVDKLMAEAATTLDDAKLRDLQNQADEIMSKDAYSLPLYQKPVFLAVYSDYVNIRNNATLFGPTYNMQEWGLKG